MPRVRLSELTRTDLSEIADYTIGTFGKEQAGKYREGFRLVFERLLRMPKSGRRVERFSEDLRATDYTSHTIYYRQIGDDILIVRILRHSMDAKRQLD